MIRRIIASTVVLLAVSAGVAYAATQLTSSEPTQVCVNDVTGLMRADDTCRQSEHAITIGGGGDIQVTQDGTFTVAADNSTTAVALPQSGITVSGQCDLVDAPEPYNDSLLARAHLQAAAGETMDAFGAAQGGEVIGGNSFLSYPLGAASLDSSEHGSGWTTVIASSKDATATVNVGGAADWGDQTCTFLWQAVEAPN